MGWITALASLGVAAWNAYANWQKSQEEQQLAKESYNATVAALHQQLAEQRKMEAYLSYGILGLGITALLIKR